MAEEKIETVSTTTAQKSGGTVKITIEEYNTLVRKAGEEKVTYNQTIVQKTAEQSANDKILYGNFSILGGVGLIGIGIYSRAKGIKALAKIAAGS